LIFNTLQVGKVFFIKSDNIGSPVGNKQVLDFGELVFHGLRCMPAEERSVGVGLFQRVKLALHLKNEFLVRNLE